MPTISLKGQSVPYRLIRSKRNKYVRLTVQMGSGLRVSAPRWVPEKDIPRYIRERAEWVLDKLTEFAKIERDMPHQRYTHNARVMFLGRSYALRIHKGLNGMAQAKLLGSRMHVALPEPLLHQHREECVRMVMHRWYRTQAEKIIRDRVMMYAVAMDVNPARVSIRKQKTRWGSCSADGNVNINQFLVKAPPKIIDYVIVHELAHLREHNHSPNFWTLVEHHCPDRLVSQQWLKDHVYLLEHT
jgi:predicted metal-dependent hydrolase